MIDVFSTGALLLLIVLISWKIFNRKASGNFPKGPFSLPILGNVVSLRTKPYLVFSRWAKEYGRIYQIFIGGNRHFVLSDLDLIKKAFNHPNFAARPRVEMWMFDDDFYGINVTSGQTWQEQRRFAIRNLREFGLGKTSTESLILEEVEEILEWMQTHSESSIKLNRRFILAMLNTLWRLITGMRFKQDDPKLNGIYQQLFESSRNINPFIIFFAPKLAKIIPNLSGWNKLKIAFANSIEVIRPVIDNHQSKFSNKLDQNPEDFIDAYLREIETTKDENSSFYGEKGVKNLRQVVMDLFLAGAFPTSLTLVWAVLYLILHVDVQEKLQKEIDEVIGSNRSPSLSDRASMIYTEAVICETLRKSSLSPTGGFHAANEDSTFEGYDVPKDTAFVANQYYVHHDPEIWGDPDTFRPERFINSDGKLYMKDRLIPFSTGKRACIGETLARDEIFLFLTSFFQRYDFRPDPTRDLPTMNPRPILDTLEPPECFVVIKKRKVT